MSESRFIDFDNIVVEEVVLPYREKPYVKMSFADTVLSGYEVIVVEDTKCAEGGEGNRLVTIIGRFPRAILSEVNTHRLFSRNSASSRARSVKSTISSVMNDPYIPPFTRNQKGMSGKFLSEDQWDRATELWLQARDSAVLSEIALLADGLISPDENTIDRWEENVDKYQEHYNSATDDDNFLSLHKQDANRVIEPFMWHEAIITSAFWHNFLDLRTDLSAAQPGIVAFAKLVEKALEVSVPSDRWAHVPFVDSSLLDDKDASEEELRELLMRSATESAQISYREKATAQKSTAKASLGERLLKMRHLSPFEHVAFDAKKYHEHLTENYDMFSDDDDVYESNLGPSWVQLRKVFDR